MDYVKSAVHPLELWALMKFKLGGKSLIMPKYDYVSKFHLMIACTYVADLIALLAINNLYGSRIIVQ